ncbi:MAG: GntR family transcriptional regulator [Lachnospiraceae bacterium]
MGTREPKYRRIIDWVHENIKNGKLQYGDRINSENEMSAMFGLSRQTVRHAINILEQEGVVRRIQGSGTYIGCNQRQSRQEKYMNIAVISSFVDSYIFPATLRGIEDVLMKNGYMTQVAFTNDSVARERMILEHLISKDNIDGLIVEPSKSALPNPNLHYYQLLAERHIPILFFNAKYPRLDQPCVSLDDQKIACKAVKYLIDNGHKKIGGLFKLDDGQGHLRYAGYLEALDEAGIQMEGHRVVWVDSDDMMNLERFKFDGLFKDRISDCTALMCYNDEVAYQVAAYCQKNGIAIPADLSLISIDNSDLAGLADVPFTSYPHPKGQLGRKTAENLLALIQNPGFEADYLFDADPVIRNSIKLLL